MLGTKCGRYGLKKFDFSAQRITRSIDESLRRLQTDYVDLLQAHDVEFGDVEQVINEAVPAMRRIQEQGESPVHRRYRLPAEDTGPYRGSCAG